MSVSAGPLTGRPPVFVLHFAAVVTQGLGDYLRRGFLELFIHAGFFLLALGMITVFALPRRSGRKLGRGISIVGGLVVIVGYLVWFLSRR